MQNPYKTMQAVNPQTQFGKIQKQKKDVKNKKLNEIRNLVEYVAAPYQSTIATLETEPTRLNKDHDLPEDIFNL